MEGFKSRLFNLDEQKYFITKPSGPFILLKGSQCSFKWNRKGNMAT